MYYNSKSKRTEIVQSSKPPRSVVPSYVLLLLSSTTATAPRRPLPWLLPCHPAQQAPSPAPPQVNPVEQHPPLPLRPLPPGPLASRWWAGWGTGRAKCCGLGQELDWAQLLGR